MSILKTETFNMANPQKAFLIYAEFFFVSFKIIMF